MVVSCGAVEIAEEQRETEAGVGRGGPVILFC